MIADALKKNAGLKLTTFEAGRDRLENKGMIALAKVIGPMNSIVNMSVPQNGVKDEGMHELILQMTS